MKDGGGGGGVDARPEGLLPVKGSTLKRGNFANPARTIRQALTRHFSADDLLVSASRLQRGGLCAFHCNTTNKWRKVTLVTLAQLTHLFISLLHQTITRLACYWRKVKRQDGDCYALVIAVRSTTE